MLWLVIFAYIDFPSFIHTALAVWLVWSWNPLLQENALFVWPIQATVILAYSFCLWLPQVHP